MRTRLRIAGALLLLITLLLWLTTGAHTGWSKTSVTTTKVDPITELEYPETENTFVAGVEVLAAGAITALVLLGCSFLFKKQPTKN